MKKLRWWPRLSLEKYTVLAVVIAASALLLFRLVSLLPGMSSIERVLPNASTSLQAAWELPLQLPHLLTSAIVAVFASDPGIGMARMPSVLLALVLAVMSYWLLKRWYGFRLALFGALLLITAPWFLRLGRLATPDIMYPLGMTTVMVLAALWHNPKQQGRLLLYGGAAASALLLYIPGMIWLLLGIIIIERRNLLAQLKASKLHTTLSTLLAIVLLIPLVHSAAMHWQNIRLFAGLPSTLPNGLDFLQAFGQTWQHLFIGGWHNPIYNLGGLSLINIVVSIFFIVGVYLHVLHPKSARTRTHAFLWLTGTALIALQVVSFSIILPIVLVLAVGGVGYLLHLWLKVFPRNPLARTFGIGLMAAVLFFAVAYNVRNYFIAWPGAPETRAAFQKQL